MLRRSAPESPDLRRPSTRPLPSRQPFGSCRSRRSWAAPLVHGGPLLWHAERKQAIGPAEGVYRRCRGYHDAMTIAPETLILVALVVFVGYTIFGATGFGASPITIP